MIYLSISDKVLTQEDVSAICSLPDTGNKWVKVENCEIRDLDIATTNPYVVFFDCRFINSELIAPTNVIHKSMGNIFGEYKGIKKKRHPIRVVVQKLV